MLYHARVQHLVDKRAHTKCTLPTTCICDDATGGIAGGCGAAVGSPFFLVKARLQGQSKVHQIRYALVLSTYTTMDNVY